MDKFQIKMKQYRNINLSRPHTADDADCQCSLKRLDPVKNEVFFYELFWSCFHKLHFDTTASRTGK